MTEIAFERLSPTFAAEAVRYGAAIWTYRLDWAPRRSSFGACHCLELPLIFGTESAWADAPMLTGPIDDARDALARFMRATWLSFAEDGRPCADDLWPPYAAQQPTRMTFDETSATAFQTVGATER
jgi:para-nitrobenzyl esterase